MWLISLAAVRGGTFVQRKETGILHKFPISLAGQQCDKEPGPPLQVATVLERPVSGCLDVSRGPCFAATGPRRPPGSVGEDARPGARGGWGGREGRGPQTLRLRAGRPALTWPPFRVCVLDRGGRTCVRLMGVGERGT